MSQNKFKYKKLAMVFIFGIVFTFISPLALSDSPAPPTDFSEATENKKYVFVMLSPWGNSALKYEKSGLYKNNGTLIPDWTVDWYSYGVQPNSDGKHLIRYGPWASSVAQEALSFFKNGILTKDYKISDLVKDTSKLEHTVSHFSWQEDSQYFEKEGVIYLKTLDQNTYVFSIYTGEILSSKNSKYLETIEKVKKYNLAEKEKKEAERQSRIVTESVNLDEGIKLIARSIISRLPMKFTIEDAKELSYSLVEADDKTNLIIWTKVLPLIKSSNRILETTIDGKKYYQKK